MSRRSFMAGLGAATVVSPAVLLDARTVSTGPVLTRYFFLAPYEANFIEAACERLIPVDASGSGAREARVVDYVDAQLAGPWGNGEQPYRDGPWQPGTPVHPSPQPVKPAHLFRTTIAAIRRDLVNRGVSGEVEFGELPEVEQDAYLRLLESGEAALPGVHTALFFRLLLTLTIEGFFGNPHHGISRDRVGWRLPGFPGAHAAPSFGFVLGGRVES